jgi:energy-coupling factor transporter ATP-binding protein EcfA2
MKTASQVQSWRAIEALRAGVPNRDAVQALGSSQFGIEELFRRQLAALRDGFSQEAKAEGTLIAGDFGSGKSHLLEYLQHIALANNFVCSKVVISKETPLYDPAKVYNAAIQSAKVPDRAGAALVAVTGKLDFNSPQYAQFYQWVNHPGSGLSTRFAATVFVLEHGRGDRNPEVSDRIIQFWSGSRIAVAELRNWLRELGEAATYKIDKATVKDLALQRYQFIPRLMVAAGYAGWVILVDEVELIGRYSLRQRAKSYAEVARLLGKLEGPDVPGLTTVLAITSAFESEVLDDPRRNDEERIPGRLRAGGSDEELLLASQVERGIRLIRRDRVRLEDPNEATIRDIYDKVSAIYARAYGWNPPMDYKAPDRTRRIRQHVKRWINEWDLKRLYPAYTPEIEVTELRQDYSERPELEVPTADKVDEGDSNS